MEYFDWHKWHPGHYRTAAEMNVALDAFGVKGKEIVGVHVIGIAQNMVPWSYTNIMRNKLAEVGVSYDDIDSGKYPVDTTLIPHEVDICEPVVILFSDGTTLELKPQNAEGLLMSVNQISPSTIDGTNSQNFDSDRFFACLRGRCIDEIKTINRETTSFSGSASRPEYRHNMTFQFRLKGDRESGDFGFFLWQRWEGWFKFGVTLQNFFVDLGNKTASVPFSLVKSVASNRRQIMIVEGHDGGGFFWIMPVKRSKEARFGMEEYRKEEISIDESDISSFLYYFLKKYFDASFPYEEISSDHCGTHFEWNLEYNVYSYDTMELMLDDIAECAELLEQQFDDPYLTALKDYFKWYEFDPSENRWNKNPTPKEAESIIRKNIHIATDFYRRFVRRIEAMMDNAPDYSLISFMGP